jgi:hypothetical protein
MTRIRIGLQNYTKNPKKLLKIVKNIRKTGFLRYIKYRGFCFLCGKELLTKKKIKQK